MSIQVSNVVVRNAAGDECRLGEWSGKVLLIVNVASRCGFTRQYEGLQQLQDTYGKQGFAVLGFPCNDFGGQEPGSLEEIKEFSSNTYGVSFELFDKVHAKGTVTAPYDCLVNADPAGDVEWNFEKFLVSKEGIVLARFKSAVDPQDPQLIQAIELALAN